MFLIVGLGNPDKKYEKTRHNIGFDTIDALAEQYHITMNDHKHKALCGTGVIEGVKVLLAKPLTYMNLSGDSVAEIVNFYKLDPESEMIVIFDDISLAALLQDVAHRISCALRSAWVKNHRAGISQIMCWDDFRQRIVCS